MKISQSLSVGAVAAAVSAVLASYTSLQAAHHAEPLGEYSTRVAESRLFVDGGTILRCDLFFSSSDSETVVAEKGSVVAQQVPAFVWQYSGLLPVTDYLKTVAIHSVATEQKMGRWQNVQHTFYKGLRVEGADDVDAKIAYAGAYAFAPRWPLVELIEISDQRKIPDTKLYSIEVTDPARKGFSIDDYRAMTRDIMDNPDNVTLQDIRGIVDVVDAGEASYEDSGLLVKLMRKVKILPSPASVVVEIANDEENAGSWESMPDGSEVLREVSDKVQQSQPAA